MLVSPVLQIFKLIQKLSDKSPNSWAIVTGASSGIGRAFATQLSRAGFNVLLMARREDKLLQAKNELLDQFPSIKVDYLSFDFSETFSHRDFLRQEVERITSNNVGILVHMAGNSDLAYHFTDKSVERSIEVTRLCVESTQVLFHLFCPLMSTRSRSAIVTSGALTATLAQSTFAMSSANKHFVRALSLAAGREFSEKIDIVCAHPIVVESEIAVRVPKIASISSDTFSRNVLSQLGSHVAETNGSYYHDILMWIFSNLGDFSRTIITLNSYFLNRPVDIRTLDTKFSNDTQVASLESDL